jgi:hypothetical protein
LHTDGTEYVGFGGFGKEWGIGELYDSCLVPASEWEIEEKHGSRLVPTSQPPRSVYEGEIIAKRIQNKKDKHNQDISVMQMVHHVLEEHPEMVPDYMHIPLEYMPCEKVDGIAVRPEY